MWKLLIAVVVAYGILNMPSTQANPANEQADFGPYLADLKRKISRIWSPPKGRGADKIVVRFEVNSSGNVSNVRLVRKSKVSDANDIILHEMQSLAARPLPPGAKSKVNFQFTFETTSRGGEAEYEVTLVDAPISAQQQVKIDSVKTAIEQMQGFSMRFRPSGRSDGRPDLEAIKRDRIANVLRAGGVKSVQALAQELKNPDLSMRQNASFELLELGGEFGTAKIDITAAVPALIEALNDTDFSVRVWSMSALGSLGPAAKAAVPALKQATKDRDQGIRTSAKAALAKLTN